MQVDQSKHGVQRLIIGGKFRHNELSIFSKPDDHFITFRNYVDGKDQYLGCIDKKQAAELRDYLSAWIETGSFIPPVTQG